jgi:ribosomal protein S18 acetylase RimI-like enzyme
MDAVDLRGGFDLLRMLRLTQASWSPTARWHVGDLAWERRLHGGPAAEWPTRLWLEGDVDRPVAWGWITRPDRFELVVGRSEDESLCLEVVDWAIGVVGDTAPLVATVTEDQAAIRAALARRGFTRTGAHGQHYLACDPGAVAPARAPGGFNVRPLQEGEDELVARVAVHVASWSSTTMTRDVYQRLQRTWPYRLDLDVVAELNRPDAAPQFAASCLGWLDVDHRVGELEPVGTDPAFRRRGLAAAVCAESVRRLHAAGASRAIVYCSADPDYAAPLALYRSLGFEPVTRTLELRRN